MQEAMERYRTLFAESVSHSATFFSYNKLVSSVFCHGLSGKRTSRRNGRESPLQDFCCLLCPLMGPATAPLLCACATSLAHISSLHPRHPSSLPAPCLFIEMELELMKKLCQMVFFFKRGVRRPRAKGKWKPKTLKAAREPYQTGPNLRCREDKFIFVPTCAQLITPCTSAGKLILDGCQGQLAMTKACV